MRQRVTNPIDYCERQIRSLPHLQGGANSGPWELREQVFGSM